MNDDMYKKEENNNESNNNTFDDNVNTNNKFIYLILAVLITIFGGYIIFSSINSIVNLSSEPYGVLGVPSQIFIVLLSVLAIIIFWTFYYIIKNNRIKKIHFDKNTKTKIKKYCLIIVCVFIIIMIISNISNKFNDNIQKEQQGIAYYLDKVPNFQTYRENNYFFIYKDKIYFYAKEETENNKYNHSLYVMDMDGNNKSLIATDDRLESASFFLTYKDESYFYNAEDNVQIDSDVELINKKINLKTGEIVSLENKYDIYANTFENGMVYSYGVRFPRNNEERLFRKIDLNTNDVIFKSNINYEPEDSIYYDYINGNSYTINSNRGKFVLFQDNRRISEIDPNLDTSTTESWNSVLLKKNNYLYLTFRNYIIKYNLLTNSIEEKNKYKINEGEKTFNINRYSIIDTNDKNNSYIYYDGKIYLLDIENLMFKELLEIPKEYLYPGEFDFNGSLFVNNSQYIFMFNMNRLKYLRNDSLGSVYIYSNDLSTSKIINDVRKTSFDYENKKIYFVIKDKNSYKIEKYNID